MTNDVLSSFSRSQKSKAFFLCCYNIQTFIYQRFLVVKFTDIEESVIFMICVP